MCNKNVQTYVHSESPPRTKQQDGSVCVNSITSHTIYRICYIIYVERYYLHRTPQTSQYSTPSYCDNNRTTRSHAERNDTTTFLRRKKRKHFASFRKSRRSQWRRAADRWPQVQPPALLCTCFETESPALFRRKRCPSPTN